jgi:predicted transcriptional regulator
LQKSASPSKSAERIKVYLELIESSVSEKGYAKRYDILKKTMNEGQTSRIIKYLLNNRLAREVEGGYALTRDGTDFLEILRKHRNLVGLLTKELSGDRIRPQS